MKRATVLFLTLSLILSVFTVPVYADGETLTGYWSDPEPIHNGQSSALYLNDKVTNCTELTMKVSIAEYTGYPFGNWYLYAKDLKGNWNHIADFKLTKDMGNGHPETYTFRFRQGQSFQALALCMRDKGNSYNLTWDEITFTLGSGNRQANVTPTPRPLVGRGKELSGTWHDQEPIRGGFYSPFYLSEKMTRCTDLTMSLEITDYTGYPFQAWYLYAMDFDGNWDHIAEFSIDKDQGNGGERLYDFHFRTPVSFMALAICVRDKGAEFNITHIIKFYA